MTNELLSQLAKIGRSHKLEIELYFDGGCSDPTWHIIIRYPPEYQPQKYFSTKGVLDRILEEANKNINEYLLSINTAY